eukprot:scaffold31018_cov112-Isochrysis_galbana.AAC.1
MWRARLRRRRSGRWRYARRHPQRASRARRVRRVQGPRKVRMLPCGRARNGRQWTRPRLRRVQRRPRGGGTRVASRASATAAKSGPTGGRCEPRQTKGRPNRHVLQLGFGIEHQFGHVARRDQQAADDIKHVQHRASARQLPLAAEHRDAGNQHEDKEQQQDEEAYVQNGGIAMVPRCALASRAETAAAVGQ